MSGASGSPFIAQDEGERREIRQDYRKLMDELRDNKQTLVDPSDMNNLLQQKLLTADKLFERVRLPREATLDSHSLVQMTDLCKKKAQALQTDFVKFQPSDFCERLKVAQGCDLSTSGLSAAQWRELGRKYQPMYNKTPILKFMCGSFERGEVCLKRARAPRGKDLDATVGKATQPTQLSTLAEAGRGELTTAHVENLLETLWRLYEAGDNEPIDFFEFVTHPTSFGQTVENIFYTSFLVRDGHARVLVGDDGLPFIEPVEEQDSESMNMFEDSLDKSQMIFHLTPQMWKEIVTTFKIQEPLINPVKMPNS